MGGLARVEHLGHGLSDAVGWPIWAVGFGDVVWLECLGRGCLMVRDV